MDDVVYAMPGAPREHRVPILKCRAAAGNVVRPLP
jgi:hypothetical protein